MELSVVIPVGDFERDKHFLIETIKAAQTQEIRIIMVLDETNNKKFNEIRNDILFDYGSSLSVIQYNGKNPGGARNVGLECVETDWVQFCDSDDRPYLSASINAIAEFDNEELDAIVGGYEQNRGGVLTSRITEHRSELISLVDLGLSPGLWRWIFRTNSLENVAFPEYRLGEDQVFLARFLASNPKLIFTFSTCLYQYNKYGKNRLTTNFSGFELEKAKGQLATLDLKKTEIRKKLVIIVMYCRITLTLSLRRGDNAKKWFPVLPIKQYIITFWSCICVIFNWRNSFED